MNPQYNLYIFSATLPYGLGESYFEIELESLSQHTEVMRIFPLIQEGVLMRSIPSNAKIEQIPVFYNKTRISKEWESFKIMIFDFWKSKNKAKYISYWRTQRSLLKKAIFLADYLADDFDLENNKNIFYSLWMNDWALALAILKKRGKINGFFFRVNGFDIYDERSKYGFIPFRRFIYSNCTKVFTVSEVAKKYISDKYGFHSKIETAYFGTEDVGYFYPDEKRKPFKILSCSRLVQLKNVVQIAHVIGQLDFEVIWMHHGDGPEFPRIREVVDSFPDNVKFIHSQMVEDHRQAILKQKEFEPDIFISLSETEGLPVTIINIISMGVPVISTDVGGCREVVNNQTGVLLGIRATDQEVLGAIRSMRNGNCRSKATRNSVREFWVQNFSAEVRYADFSRKLFKYLD